MNKYFLKDGLSNKRQGEFATYQIELCGLAYNVFEENEKGKIYVGAVVRVNTFPAYHATYIRIDGWMEGENGDQLITLINWVISQREAELRKHYAGLKVV